MNKEQDVKNNVRVAVVGGGIFGCTVAIMLAKAGLNVDLYESSGEIMTAASAINQYRIHRGYHYPRSSETITSCKLSAPLFEKEYEEAIIRKCKHYYCIAREGSLISRGQYLSVLDEHELPYKIEIPPHVNENAIELSICVDENLFDPVILKEILRTRLEDSGVNVFLNRSVMTNDLSGYGFVVVAAYAAMNQVLGDNAEAKRTYQFEVCEKIVIEIPDIQRNISTVIMDGPFMSFDPFGSTGYAVMGHVEHAIHARNIGHEPEIPKNIMPLLNKGLIKDPPVSNAGKFLEAGAKFMPALADAGYIGSMYTIRTVLPNVDDTDTRPTIVSSIGDRVITVYSGKIGNCVQAARDVLDLISGRID